MPPNNQMLIQLPQGTTARAGHRALDQTAGHGRVGYLQKANLGKFEVIADASSSARSSGRTCSGKGIYATIGSLLGIMVYIAFRFRSQLRHRRDGGEHSRRADHAVVPDVLRLRPVAERRRRDPHARRLRRERPDRHLRPRAREPALAPARADERHHQPERQPDAAADGDHGRHRRSWRCCRCICSAARCSSRSRSRCWSASSASTYSTVFIASAMAMLLSPRPHSAAAPASSGDAAGQGGRKPKRAKAS